MPKSSLPVVSILMPSSSNSVIETNCAAKQRKSAKASPRSSTQHSASGSTIGSTSFNMYIIAFCTLFTLVSSHQRRAAVGGATFTLPNECYHRYANSDHHSSLTNWLHHKNSSHYSPISPSYNQALIKIQTTELADGLQITSGASSCNTRKMKVISSSTPLRERALCQFEYVLNYKPNRIPSTLTEVRCSCQRPSVRLVGKRMFECEPLRYQVRVLLFDPECLTYVEHTETIALACIPVLQANVHADSDPFEDDSLIQVPAEAPLFTPT